MSQKKPELVSLQRHMGEVKSLSDGDKRDLGRVYADLAVAVKMIHSQVTRAGLVGILGEAGRQNVQGEVVQKLDEYAQRAMVDLLSGNEQVRGMVSEEEENIIQGNKDGKYVVMFDPLDGSSNIDVNVSVGTVWSVYKSRRTKGRCTKAEMLRPGREQVSAGYAIYGSSTMLVYSVGEGVHGFTFDPLSGEFYLTHSRIKMPKGGKHYSINEGYARYYNQRILDYLDYLRVKEDRSVRYTGTMVADVHRTLLNGGVFMHPALPKPKLRLLYECNPMAFLAEQVGGAATNGEQRVLDIKPKELHQRLPLVLGEKKVVDRY